MKLKPQQPIDTLRGGLLPISTGRFLTEFQIGNEADVTILRLEKCNIELEDSRGETRTIRQKIVPVRVFRAGVEYPVREVTPWPNPASREKCQSSAKQYATYAQSKK